MAYRCSWRRNVLAYCLFVFAGQVAVICLIGLFSSIGMVESAPIIEEGETSGKNCVNRGPKKHNILQIISTKSHVEKSSSEEKEKEAESDKKETVKSSGKKPSGTRKSSGASPSTPKDSDKKGSSDRKESEPKKSSSSSSSSSKDSGKKELSDKKDSEPKKTSSSPSPSSAKDSGKKESSDKKESEPKKTSSSPTPPSSKDSGKKESSDKKTTSSPSPPSSKDSAKKESSDNKNSEKKDSADSKDDKNKDMKAEYTKFLLEEHNRLRKIHHAPPLKLKDAITKKAEQCAEYYVKNQKYDHSCPHKKSVDDPDEKYGENIYYSTKTSRNQLEHAQTAMDGWYIEWKHWDFAKGEMKAESKKDKTAKTGHFTQMVWLEDTLLGVGLKQKDKITAVVCLYDPHGNVKGEYKENVLKA